MQNFKKIFFAPHNELTLRSSPVEVVNAYFKPIKDWIKAHPDIHGAPILAWAENPRANLVIDILKTSLASDDPEIKKQRHKVIRSDAFKPLFNATKSLGIPVFNFEELPVPSAAPLPTEIPATVEVLPAEQLQQAVVMVTQFTNNHERVAGDFYPLLTDLERILEADDDIARGPAINALISAVLNDEKLLADDHVLARVLSLTTKLFDKNNYQPSAKWLVNLIASQKSSNQQTRDLLTRSVENLGPEFIKTILETPKTHDVYYHYLYNLDANSDRAGELISEAISVFKNGDSADKARAKVLEKKLKPLTMPVPAKKEAVASTDINDDEIRFFLTEQKKLGFLSDLLEENDLIINAEKVFRTSPFRLQNKEIEPIFQILNGKAIRQRLDKPAYIEPALRLLFEDVSVQNGADTVSAAKVIIQLTKTLKKSGLDFDPLVDLKTYLTAKEKRLKTAGFSEMDLKKIRTIRALVDSIKYKETI